MKILIATDGSEFSKAAISEWCRIAGPPAGLEIKIISVYRNSYVLAGEPFTLAPEYLQEIIDSAKKQSEHFTDEAESIIREKLGDSVKIGKEVIPGVEPEQQILQEAEDWGPDMIVVGSHGRGVFGRILGSVSDSVVHHAGSSVLIGREKKDKEP